MLNVLKALETPMEMAGRLANLIKQGKSDTLQQYTQSTELGPIALIDKRLLALDQDLLTALLQTLLSLYCGYYLVGVNLAMNVDNVKVMSILNTFGTNKSVLTAVGSSPWLNSNEAWDKPYLPVLTNEAYADDVTRSIELNKGYNKDPVAIITDESNLVVGKIINVQCSGLGSGGTNAITVNIPIRAVLYPKSIGAESIISIAEFASKDLSWTGRYKALKSTEIEFVKDYLFCMDVIEAHRKAADADTTGTLLAHQSGKLNNLVTALISGQGSPNNFSTTIIISKQTANEMRLAIKGDLKDFHTREKYFKGTALATIVVVDARSETFTIYYRGVNNYGTYTLQDIKKNNKSNNGLDIKSVVAAYKLGDAPSL
jgi:hypothetical protein